MGEAPRRTLKVASVVGRVFKARCCPASIRSSAPLERSSSTSSTLRAADLVSVDREAEQAYLFKHVVTQEVAYESLPFAIAGHAARPGRAATSRRPPATRSSASSTCSPTTTG